MEKATLFKNGGSQAVRLPRKFRLEGTEVYIRKVPEGILLMPKEEYADLIWKEWLDNLDKHDEIIEVERGGDPQVREGLDELFP